MLPKSSAELLAAAKLVSPNQICKPKIKRDLHYSQHLSTIPITPTAEISTVSFHSAQFQPEDGTQIRFNEPMTPQSLGSAFEIDSDIGSEDLFDDDSVLLPTWVVTQYC